MSVVCFENKQKETLEHTEFVTLGVARHHLV